MELEHWKIIEEKRILEAHLIEETALKMVEWEKAKSRAANEAAEAAQDRKSTRLNSSHLRRSRMPSSA